jgi:hypothetical protein
MAASRRRPGPPYVANFEVAELNRLTSTVEQWAGQILRERPVHAGDLLKLVRYARRLLPPRIVAKEPSSQTDLFGEVSAK